LRQLQRFFLNKKEGESGRGEMTDWRIVLRNKAAIGKGLRQRASQMQSFKKRRIK